MYLKIKMTQPSKKKVIVGVIGALAVAILLPLSFYGIVQLMGRESIKLPGYYVADRVVDGKKVYDTTFHKVGELVAVNQLGKRVLLNEDLKGKILVINFFFTDCPTVCPRLTRSMAMLQKAFRRDPKLESVYSDSIQLISISVNPATDTFQKLREYANRFGANHDHWWFLTGDKKDIYNYARHELHVLTGTGDGGADDFIHTQSIVLVDKHRHIRGYYDGLDSAAIKKCAEDIVWLTLQKDRKKKNR